SGAIFGRRLRLARQRSYAACIRSHYSADPPSAADSRSAISALTAARPLITRESATRDTPSRRANSVTLSSARTVSRRTSVDGRNSGVGGDRGLSLIYR